MGKLMQSLGLGDISANVNEVPDGKYDAIVTASEWFFNEGKDTVSHTITYKIDSNDPATKGKSKQEFFNLGKEPRDANGVFTKSEDELTHYVNTQTEMNKQFHKKRFVDLLADNNPQSKKEVEAAVDAGQIEPANLVGVKCVVNIKTKDGFQNVAGAWKRDGAAPVAATQAVSLGTTAPVASTPAPTPEVAAAPQPAAPTGIVGIAGGLQ